MTSVLRITGRLDRSSPPGDPHHYLNSAQTWPQAGLRAVPARRHPARIPGGPGKAEQNRPHAGHPGGGWVPHGGLGCLGDREGAAPGPSSGSTSTAWTKRPPTCCATPSGSTRSPSRTPRTSASGRRSTSSTTSPTSWSTAPFPTEPASSSCTSSSPQTQSVVTVHQGECPALADVRSAHRPPSRNRGRLAAPVALLYMIVDSLVDTFFPVLSRFDDKIDELEDDILRQPTEAQLGVLFDMKRIADRHAQSGHSPAGHVRRAGRRASSSLRG